MRVSRNPLHYLALTLLVVVACSSTRDSREAKKFATVPEECTHYAEQLRQCFPGTKSLAEVEATFETKELDAEGKAKMAASCAAQSQRLEASCLRSALTNELAK
jgi:hypothetical protein